MKLLTVTGILILTGVSMITPLSFESDRMPEPYKSVRTLPLKIHGWFPEINRQHLHRFLYAMRPKIVVHLGSWLGLESVFMASHLPKGGKLYAVDMWSGINPMAASSDKISTLYQQFLSNVKHHGLTEVIHPVKMSAVEAAAALNLKPDFIYVDGSDKEDEVYEMVLAWYAKLAVGGMMCGDDFEHPDVAAGVRKAALLLNQSVNVDRNFWHFNAKQ